jgi:hypothetical protein
MQIRSLHEIEQDLIYQEPNYENKSFWTFLIDFKRSDRYSSTLSFVLFMALIWIFMFFTIIYKKDYMFFISIGFALLFCFIFAQFLLWNFVTKSKMIISCSVLFYLKNAILLVQGNL